MIPDMELSDLTIAIPAFRCARYLPATVASALHCPGAAIVIAEDCSGDDTLAVARELEKQNPSRVRVIANPKNLGMTGNWQSTPANHHALHPEARRRRPDHAAYVQAAMQFLKSYPEASIIGGERIDVDENFGVDGNLPPDKPFSPADFQLMSGVQALDFLIRWQPYPASASTIYHMPRWRAAGGFNGKLGWCSDRDMWFRIGHTSAIVYSPRPAIYYRVLPTSVTSRVSTGDLYPFELSIMLRDARKRWREPQFRALTRRGLLVNAKAFGGSIRRAAKAKRYGEMFPRALKSVEELWHAFF